MNPNQHFFQTFFGPQNTPEAQKIPEYIIHNEIVFEILNNWEYAKDLMKRYKTGKLKQMDQMEQLWYNFLVSKNIDISSYKDEDEFKNAICEKISIDKE